MAISKSRSDEIAHLIDRHRQFCRAHMGKPVFVGGMWPGNFIGTIVSEGATRFEVRFDKSLSEFGAVNDPKVGDVIDLAYGSYLRLRELEDSEKQLTISEVYGDINV
jgi:hypothetical protein